jgi:hypothetical protein
LHVALMHNPTAGDERHSRESLVAILADEGHKVIYQSVKDERWHEALGRAPSWSWSPEATAPCARSSRRFPEPGRP